MPASPTTTPPNTADDGSGTAVVTENVVTPLRSPAYVVTEVDPVVQFDALLIAASSCACVPEVVPL